MKKLVTILLTFALAFSLFGCKNATTAKKQDVTTKKVVSKTQVETKKVDTTTAKKEIESFNLGGQTIRIATKRAADFNYAYTNDLDPTKIRNKDDDTAYWTVVEQTTKYIENKYNCKIEWVDLSSISEANAWTHYQNVYASGTIYDICEVSGEEFPYMYMNDMVQELPEDYLSEDVADLFWGGSEGFQYNAYTHLDKKWGVGSSNTIYDASINNSNALPPVILYNIDLLESAGVEKMPSEYWEEGTWTWDVFETMCLQVVNNLPGVQGLGDHAYAGGIQNFLGANGTFVFDDYGNMGFYSEPAQQVYTKWNQWTANKVLYNYTWSTNGAPDAYWNRRWLMNEECAMQAGYFSDINTYYKDINVSCVPYPAGPNALKQDGTIDLDKYMFNWYTTGYFWTVPKGKDLRCYQILAEFYGGLKEYYKNADDLDATIEDFVYTYFPIDECDYVIDLLKYIQENMNFLIIQSAVPSGIFRQSIREHYTKSSAYYGEMWNYMQSRRNEVSPDNPNNYWLCIFGEPGNLPQ